MDGQRSADPAAAATTARVIHAAVMGGVVIAFGVFLFLRTRFSLDAPAGSARLLRLIGYVGLGMGVLGSGMLRARIATRRRGEDLGAWWVVNLSRAVPVWALAEAGGLAAMVLGWLIGDPTLLALGAAGALAMLFVSRPSRLQSEI
jgi:hypothetical protein